MRTLITNDDGIGSEGIRALTRAALESGLDVVVAAPSWDSSGASASLTAVETDGRLVVEERVFEGLEEVPAFAVEAAPAFIVRAAANGAFGSPPDLVLSGVNHGLNTGHAVLHSGTVGAALTGSIHGLPAAAFSIAAGPSVHWDTATGVARSAIEWLVASRPSAVLNVNIPNVPRSEVRGLEPGRLAPFGAVNTHVTESGKGYVKLAVEETTEQADPGTDAALIAAGFASYTPLLAACEGHLGRLAGLDLEPVIAGETVGAGRRR